MREALERRDRLAAVPDEHSKEKLLQRGPFSIDRAKHLVSQNGQPVDLTPREFRLLSHLIENAHRVVPPKELVRVVQQYECDSLHEARQIIKWYIHRLRKKVEPDPSHPRYVVNVRGVGYRFGQ